MGRVKGRIRKRSMERRFCIIVSEASWNKALCLNNTACAIMVSFIFPEFLIRPNCNSVTISCSMRSIVPRGKNLLTNVRVDSLLAFHILACRLSLLNQTICFFLFLFLHFLHCLIFIDYFVYLLNFVSLPCSLPFSMYYHNKLSK